MRCALVLLMTTFVATASAAPAPVDDVQAWLAARGVTASPLEPWGVGNCVEQDVGKRHERALVCEEVVDASAGSRDNPVYRVVTHRVALVVRARKIVPVLDVETTIQVLDAIPRRIGKGGVQHDAILALSVTIAGDGMSATVGDNTDPAWESRESCKDVHVYKPTKEDRDNGMVEWNTFDNGLLRRLCSRRGTYVWKGDRFVRAR